MEMDLILKPGHGTPRECCKRHGRWLERGGQIESEVGKWKRFDSAHTTVGKRHKCMLYAQMPQRAK